MNENRPFLHSEKWSVFLKPEHLNISIEESQLKGGEWPDFAFFNRSFAVF